MTKSQIAWTRPQPGGDVAEQVPGDLAQAVGFAVAAAHQVDERLVGQFRHRHFPRVGRHPVQLAAVLDGRIAPHGEVAGGRHEPAAPVAEHIAVG